MAQAQEYVVRVPKESTKKKYHVMRFSNALNVDVTKWKSAKLARENNARELKGFDEDAPKFGAGSEFGREQKDEARRKKYGGRKKYNPDDQPWILNVGGKLGKKFRGIREGGVSENTSYYVFFQASDGAFEAFPVSEWYNFAPIHRYKALTAEEAEEQFEKRDKILNFFSVMDSKKKKDIEAGESSGFGEEKMKGKRAKNEFKVSDMDDWGMDSDAERGDDSEDEKPKGKGKKKVAKKATKKKKKKESDEEEDSAQEESDEGDFDTREVDYMSQSSSGEDSDEGKTNTELKGVEDEDALRQLVISDEEEEENPEGGENANKEEKKPGAEEPKKPGEGEVKVKQEKAEVSESSASDESDDSDFDDAKFQSGIFMQKKLKSRNSGSEPSASISKATTPLDASTSVKTEDKDTEQVIKSGSSKRKAFSGEGSAPNKKAKLSEAASNDGITEDAIKRYLVRKPMTTTELLQKFKSKKLSLSSDSCDQLVQILKRLNPEKQKLNGKLYLSLKP